MALRPAWPSACGRVARLFTHSLAGTTREHCPWKEDQWNIGYWIVASLLLLTLQNYFQAAKTVEPRALQRIRRRWPRRVAVRGPHGHRAPGIAGRPGQDHHRGHCVEPDLAERLSKYDVPYAPGGSTWLRDALLDSAGGGLLRRLVLPVPPLRREAGHGRL